MSLPFAILNLDSGFALALYLFKIVGDHMKEQYNLAENQFIVYEELPLPKEIQAEARKNKQLLCDNLELILGSADKIINTPEFFHIRHKWSYIGSNWVGVRHIPLGVLLLLWQEGLCIDQCPNCRGKIYIFRAGGFILSGWYRYEAICPSCRELVIGSRNTGLALLVKPAFDLYKSNVQRKKLLRTRGPRFSWSKGVVGEKVPDKVLEDVVKPVSLENMVEMLQKRV